MTEVVVRRKEVIKRMYKVLSVSVQGNGSC